MFQNNKSFKIQIKSNEEGAFEAKNNSVLDNKNTL